MGEKNFQRIRTLNCITVLLATAKTCDILIVMSLVISVLQVSGVVLVLLEHKLLVHFIEACARKKYKIEISHLRKE